MYRMLRKIYLTLILLEIFYIFLAWSPYGSTDGAFYPFYSYVRSNLNGFIITSILLLTLISFIFPGVGWMALIVTLYRVASLCCQKEHFGDGLPYGWGTFQRDDQTYLDQGLLQRETDQTRTGFSSAVGDQEDQGWLASYTTVANQHLPYLDFIWKKKECNEPTFLQPEMKEAMIHYPPQQLSENSQLTLSKTLYDAQTAPRPLYTTSLLSDQLKTS